MTKGLFIKAFSRFAMGTILVGLLIFIPAGTIAFFNGWLLMAVLFIPMFFAGIVMMLRNPELLEKRLNVKEKQSEQRSVILLSGLMFLLGFVIAGLSFRFNIYIFPTIISIVATVIFLLAYMLYAEVLRENAYLSRIIEVQENQKVIDTGLYSVVRHPMYSATMLLFLSIPFILGSLLTFFVFLLYPFIIVKRIQGEEKLLAKELSGYSEYQKKVKYRLIPFIW